MYILFTANSRTEKLLGKYLKQRPDLKRKLDRLRENPSRSLDAHPLHGPLAGKWSCWLGSNLRAIYSINEKDKSIIIEAIGSHAIY